MPIEQGGSPNNPDPSTETKQDDIISNQTSGDQKTKLVDEDGNNIGVQDPLPTDGDSVYVKDLDIRNCDNGDFSGSVTDYFDSLKTVNANSTATNPKIIKLWFKRTIYSHAIGFGCDNLAVGFGTSITIKLLGSGEAVRYSKTFTPSDPNSFLAEFGPKAFNGVQIEFNTASQVCLSNLTIAKAIETTATLAALKPDGTITKIDATAGGNLKFSLEELESGVSSNSNSQLNVTPFHADGSEGNLISGVNYVSGKSGIDQSTEALQQISYNHHEIHAGNHFNYCDYDISPLGASDTIEFVMTVPDTTEEPHLTFQVFSSTGATIELYEGTTGVSGGTTITPRNNNRNSTHASSVTLVKDPTTITSDGTRAAGYLAGANRNAGFIIRENENVLKRNTAYLVRITSLASSNNISWCAEWYEHTPKN